MAGLHFGMVYYRRVHSDNPDDVFFLTLVTRERIPHFQTRDDFAKLWKSMVKPLEMADAELIAWVFLPDHLHLLLRQGKASFSRTVQRIKSNANRVFLPQRGSLWQPRFWEHRIRNVEDMNKHIEYIHYNPVKHGHCNRPFDWPYSSFRGLVERGIFSEDWSDSTAHDTLPTTGEPE